MKVQHLNEEALIKACKKQDRLAQKRLYELHYNDMMRIGMRYASTKEDAVEILNNGFLKVFTKLNYFDKEKGKFIQWISGIMIKTGIDHYRKNKKHRYTLQVNEDISHSEQAVSIEKLSGQEVLKHIQKLSPMYRLVFNLFVMDGLSHKEIAKQLNISVGTSKSNLSKAKHRLRSMINESENYILNKEAR